MEYITQPAQLTAAPNIIVVVGLHGSIIYPTRRTSSPKASEVGQADCSSVNCNNQLSNLDKRTPDYSVPST
jgi:hypothetical protein